ncbi:MAG: PH domain-containing protein [Pirellulaceae bacterium]
MFEASATSPQPPMPWLYDGIWGLLSELFRVPREAPQLPALHQEAIVSRKPAANFLRYLLIPFWITMSLLALSAIVVTVSFAISSDIRFMWLLVPFAMLLVVLWIVGYLTIHLRYDTTWYVFSDRSMRLRRGIWVIRETTITFENVQNVKVTQGPLQRLLNIADVVVETAGGGGHSQQSGEMNMHAGRIEGIEDASRIRDAILKRVGAATSAGLGDDEEHPSVSTRWTENHLDTLRQIRDAAKAMSNLRA